MPNHVELEVFADYVCPWCYLGNAVVEKLQQQYPIKLIRTPFPLHPSTPPEGLLLSELLRGVNLDTVHQRLYALMDEWGLPYGERDKTYNSRLAQELGMWANTQSGGETLHGVLYNRYFVHNQNLADHDVLLSAVAEAELDEGEARAVLEQRSFSADVDAAWSRARSLRITGVPAFVAGGYQVTGYQPLDEMQSFIEFVQGKTRSG